jgi:hypothetical protein
VAARLHPRADNRQHRRIRSGKVFRCDRRYCGGAYLGYKPPVHAGERLAGLGFEEQDSRVVSGDALILRIESYELGAQSAAGVGWHEGEEALMLGDGDYHAQRLHHLATRKVGERVLHRGDHVLHVQQAVNGRFVQVQHICVFSIAQRLRDTLLS